MANIKSLFQSEKGANAYIAGKMTINISGAKQNIDVIFERFGRRFFIILNGLSEITVGAKDFLFGNNINMPFMDEMGQEYIAFDCFCIKSKLTVNYIVLEGEYKTLLKGIKIPNCGILKIHFDGLDNYMIDCQCVEDNIIEKYNKWDLVEENGKRKIAVRLKDINDFSVLHNLIVRTREYFEFIANHELIIDEIQYKKINGEGIEIIRSDKITSEKSFVFNDKTILTKDVIFDDLDKWLIYYEEYKEPIYIWKKSIYNYNVSEEDVFLWRCQAFELLSEINKEIYDKAMELKSEKQIEPNLYNYLEALNKLHHYINCNKKELRAVKEVRNLYTHNNPKKKITKRQWHNSIHIIRLAFIEGIKFVFKMNNNESKGFYLHIAKGDLEEEKKHFDI